MGIRDHFAELWDSQDVLTSLWRIVASPHTTILLLLGLAVVVVCGIILPQRPAEALADPLAESLWITSLRERYSGTADGLLRLGLVDVYRSPWLRGLLGLLALNLLLGMVEWIDPHRWLPAGIASNETTRSLYPGTGQPAASGIRPAPAGEPSLGSQAKTGTLPRASEDGMPVLRTPEDVVERVRQILCTEGFRVRGHSPGTPSHASGENRMAYDQRFALFPLLVYIGALLVLGGAALSERTSWWEKDFVLGPGQVRALGHGTGLALRAEATGEAKTALAFLQDNREVGQRVLQAHAPLLYRGLLFHATASEPALRVKARDAAGRAVSLQTPETGATQFAEVALRFREEEASAQYIVVLSLGPGSSRQFQQKGNERYILVPSRDLTLRLRYWYSPVRGLRPSGANSVPRQQGTTTGSEPDSVPNFEVEAFRGAETSPFYRQDLTGTDVLEIAGDFYTFEPQRYTAISFGQDYGLVLIFAGAALLLAGLLLSAWQPPQRLWLLSEPTNSSMGLHLIAIPPLAAATPARASEKRSPLPWFENLVQTVATHLAWHVHSEP